MSARDPNVLRVYLRDGKAWEWKGTPQIPDMRESFERCARGEIPFVSVAARNSTIKIYSDEITRVE